MTLMTLSQSTQNAINLALTQGPGTNIYADISAQGGIQFRGWRHSRARPAPSSAR
jgi:hypothetical protein